jgi:exodeoxyribonuclease VII small subunit
MKNRKQQETGTGGDFESSLVALERIVREMERGDLPLERSLELFEQGVRLSRECQERLNEAERRIEVLLRDATGETFIEPLDELAAGRKFETDEEDDESVF